MLYHILFDAAQLQSNDLVYYLLRTNQGFIQDFLLGGGGVGGYHRCVTDNKNWTHPFPPKPIPLHGPIANSYKHWLVVAGGNRGYDVGPF